ncbi:hypothetical protein F5Y10DRAFT_262387 [Nemania abortiva]|nr:hypothetical protein F5Y10DRAFT_262387 [Nemania abortiva]
MVSIKSLAVTALAAVLPLASASPTIYSISAPASAAAGSTISVTLNTSIYIQNWEDFSIIWGLNAPNVGIEDQYEVYIGQQIGYTNLYGTTIEQLNSFTVDVTIPASQPAGKWNLVAAVPYLVGASGSTDVHAFNSTINITA